MALKDIFNLFDDKLADVFAKKAYDPAKDRAKLVKRLETQKAKFLATEPARGAKDFKIANGVVEFRPVLPGGHPLVLGGKEVNYVPSERFADVLDKLIAEVQAGEVDDQLEGKEGSAPMPRARTARAPREGGGKGWSEERRAAYAATIAARKAAKGQGE
ncbi:hypothetical protein QE363_001945 [Sphingomonas sp. SORGH_AS870]|uniref:hypothetical protein n=1 Tax=Sphingomonas sp. SORGH_AS_0870 TaxID=3041801 RepID=UPI00285B0B7B|nr:hypothetical protein [Sphingomonas sp. SORGH_AS_0870]MDR6146152.1 hypothetical protein [Sphingomonas sp. SORGH_AS_0870]